MPNKLLGVFFNGFNTNEIIDSTFFKNINKF